MGLLSSIRKAGAMPEPSAGVILRAGEQGGVVIRAADAPTGRPVRRHEGSRGQRPGDAAARSMLGRGGGSVTGKPSPSAGKADGLGAKGGVGGVEGPVDRGAQRAEHVPSLQVCHPHRARQDHGALEVLQAPGVGRAELVWSGAGLHASFLWGVVCPCTVQCRQRCLLAGWQRCIRLPWRPRGPGRGL